jgi:methylmalonyl-CoA mutase C-terminal domain/subunit
VDVIAVSILSGSHLELCADLVKAMKAKGLDRPLVFGGVIPKVDIEPLKKLGVFAVYGPGTSLSTIAQAVKDASEAKN